jgi:hypothetical protein
MATSSRRHFLRVELIVTVAAQQNHSLSGNGGGAALDGGAAARVVANPTMDKSESAPTAKQ